MKILFSVPVHENWGCVVSQLDNLLRFVPEGRVVLHVSKNFQRSWMDRFWKLVRYDDRVHINPTSLQTRWGDLVHVHLANFKYGTNLGSFDYFAMHASNDLFIRKGVGSLVGRHSCGFQCQPTSPSMSWQPAHAGRQDSALAGILEHLGSTQLVGSQIEGTYYQFSLFKEMADLIERFYRFDPQQAHYCREEIYFPSIALRLQNGASIGLPYCYSSVVRGAELTESTVEQLRATSLSESEYGQNGDAPNCYRHYDLKEIYAVKRVPRLRWDRLRKYIAQLD